MKKNEKRGEGFCTMIANACDLFWNFKPSVDFARRLDDFHIAMLFGYKDAPRIVGWEVKVGGKPEITGNVVIHKVLRFGVGHDIIALHAVGKANNCHQSKCSPRLASSSQLHRIERKEKKGGEEEFSAASFCFLLLVFLWFFFGV